MHFDIHGGGEDLQFPHHENEIAQSEGAHGDGFVDYWMHNGFVRVDDEKMSKSLGNFFTIREILARYDAEVVRFFILRAHYRSPLNYSDVHLDEARSALARLYTALKGAPRNVPAIDWSMPQAARFRAAMDDDFNTPEALAVLFELAGDANRTGSSEAVGLLRALGGVVDYTVGPAGVKIFCLAEHEDPKQRHYLNLYKMGEGPLYAFTVPYHLVHFEAPNAIARVALFGDEVAPPLGGPVVEVCAVSKRDLKAGETLDEYGMFMTYGEAVNADEMSAKRYLPEGLVEGCRLKRDIPKDQPLTYADVELPHGRLADRLRAEQYRNFRGESWLEDLLSGKPAAAA